MMSSLRGSASSIFVASVPISAISLGRYPEGSLHGLSPVLAILFGGLPFDVLVVCFFFPIFEFPGNFCSWVVVRQAYDCFDKFSFQVVLQDFDGSVVVKFNVSILD